MRLKSTTSDLPSSHDVKVHLHNVTDRDRDRCGLWKERGKKSRSGLEHVRRALERWYAWPPPALRKRDCSTSNCHLPMSSKSIRTLPPLPSSSAVIRRTPASPVVFCRLLPFPLSSAASDIDPPPSDMFRPIVCSRKSKFRNPLFPYIHALLMLRHRCLVSFRAAAVV